MKTAPLILITSCTQSAGAEFRDRSVSLSNNYSRAIAASGGIPWVAPNLPSPSLTEAMVRRADGVLLTGGDDVQPALYTRRLSPKLRQTVGAPDSLRDLFELQLIAEVFQRRKPLLAICRGLQVLNVSLGGTLLADIKLQSAGAMNHARLDAKDKIVHDVALTPGSLLSRITGKLVIGVNSSHHQAAGRVADLLGVTARSPDGVIEALELASPERDKLPFLLAVQYHPERLSGRDKSHRALFDSFVSACAFGREESL